MTKVTRATAPPILEGLRAIPYFARLPAADIAALGARCAMRPFARGAVIFEEGAEATGLWVILEGHVKVVRRSASGREQVLHAEGPGATLAEVPVFDGGGYVATAVAIDPARVLFVPRPAVLEACRRHGDVALGVIAVLARRVRTFAGLIEDLALRDVTARVADWLLAEVRRGGGDAVELPGTREEIGARLGTVRELVSRALGRLRADGIITVRGRAVRVRDAARLAALAGREPAGSARRARG
jgi:CRP/FNR family transcriptional regulator, dissimilatory nitrate respiration regulator